MSRSGYINVTAVPFSEHAQTAPLRWPVPMADRLKRPEAGEFVWRRLQYVFDTLDDPAAFAVAPKGLTDDELVVLARFVSQAERLAGTAFIAADDEVTINFGDDGEEDQILKRLSDEDVTAGHMVFLRQCYADHEEASFSKARKLVERGLHAAGETAALDQVKAWRKAHARIRNQTIEELVQERMVAEKLMPSTDRYSVDDFIDPETPPSLPFASGQRLPGVRRTRRCLRAPRTGDQGRDRRRHPR